eukprot:Lankesteria_metandrocarpae@DN6305_c0_g1_i1.p1
MGQKSCKDFLMAQNAVKWRFFSDNLTLVLYMQMRSNPQENFKMSLVKNIFDFFPEAGKQSVFHHVSGERNAEADAASRIDGKSVDSVKKTKNPDNVKDSHNRKVSEILQEGSKELPVEVSETTKTPPVKRKPWPCLMTQYDHTIGKFRPLATKIRQPVYAA